MDAVILTIRPANVATIALIVVIVLGLYYGVVRAGAALKQSRAA